MAAATGVLHRTGIAVRQHHRHACLVRGDGGGEARHHVRPIGEVGDATEAFRLALGEETAVRRIKSGQFGIVLRRDPRLDFQRAGIRHVRNDQLAVLDMVAVGTKLRTIQRKPHQRNVLAIERKRRITIASGIAPHRETRAHPRGRRIQVKRQFDACRSENAGGR